MKKKKNYFIISFFLLLFGKNIQAQTSLSPDVKKKTYTYAIKGKDTLRMDVMRANRYGNQIQPCMIFIFGGGFAGGSRDKEYYLSYFNRITNEGLTVISIDYRLLMKGKNTNISGEGSNSGKNNTLNEKKDSETFSAKAFSIPSPSIPNPINSLNPLSQYQNAIKAAVEDLFSATLYIINHKDEFNIDSNLIMLSGSSAGAITSLQGDWTLGRKAGTSNILPDNFKYKAVIGFAGAIMAGSSGVKYSTPPAPTLFFHGNQDPTVPYGTKNYIIARLTGSSSLAQIFKKNKYPYHLVTINGGDHSVSTTVMTTELDRIVNFINTFVIQKRTYQIEETI